MNMRHAVSVGVLLICQYQGLAWAQGDDGELALLYGDEESVSIATGLSKSVRLAPAVASIITADDIAAHGATDLDQVLEMVPGLHVSSSFNRLNSIYSIRGIHTGQNPQVLMLVDGVPITQITTGGRPNTFRLPVAAIARVEVMRGPGSAVYGADAYAGVINVITKKAADIAGTRAGAGAGSFSTTNVFAQYGGEAGGWQVAASVEWLKSDGDSKRTVDSDLQSTFDAMFSTDASRAPGALSTRYDILDTHLNLTRDRWTLAFWGWRQYDAGVGPGSAQALDPEGSTDEEKYLLDLSYRADGWAPDWDVTTHLTYQYLKENNRFTILPAGATVLVGTDGNLFSCGGGCAPVTFIDGVLGTPSGIDRNYSLEMTGVYQGWKGHTLRLSGGAIQHQLDTRESKNYGPGVIDGSVSPVDGTLIDVSGTEYVFMKDRQRDIWFVSAQDEWALAPDWELTAGIRYDRYSDFGSTTNPRAALVWSTTHKLTTKLLYGHAFRAPSLSELYFINNPSLVGNVDVKPETIDTAELAFDYRLTFSSRVGLSLFRYDARDLIDFVVDPGTGAQIATNTSGQTGQGLELEADWKPSSSLRLFGSYAAQRAEYKTGGDTVPDAPGQQLYAGVEWEFASYWKAALQGNWVADRKRAAGDTRAPVPDYSLAHLTLRHDDAAAGWGFTVSIHNLFDARAYEPSDPAIPGDYRLPSRSLYAQARFAL
jgi:iron complex outermembrane receptor protein